MKSLMLLMLLAVAARSQTQYVALYTSGLTNANYAVPVNALVSYVGTPASAFPKVTGYTANGNTFTMESGVSGSPSFYTGLTNVAVLSNGTTFEYATLSITIPSAPCVISNYIPANAIVIPSSVTGNVNVMLESSSDLMNWTSAEPGLYGPGNGTNRFFRVRAQLAP